MVAALRQQPWLALLCMAAIYLSIALAWYWLWGLLFLVFAAFDIYRDETWLLQTVSASHYPLAYWFIVANWLFFGFYLLAELPLSML